MQNAQKKLEACLGQRAWMCCVSRNAPTVLSAAKTRCSRCSGGGNGSSASAAAT